MHLNGVLKNNFTSPLAEAILNVRINFTGSSYSVLKELANETIELQG